MSLNDIYTKKYVPNKKREAIELISETIQEIEEELAKKFRTKFECWKNIKSSLDTMDENTREEALQRKDLPYGDPSMDALIAHRAADCKVDLTLDLLYAIRDCVA